MAPLRIEPIKPFVGGTVHVDRDQLFADETIAAIREALELRSVLVFPRLGLSDEEQLAFTDRIGPRVNFNKNAPGSGSGTTKDVYQITLDQTVNTQPEYVLGTFFWHIDGVTIDQPLPKATLLSARKLAPAGGQTEFASTYAAYEALPEDDKAAIADLKVIHRMEVSMKPVFETLTPEQYERYRSMSVVMTHPLVWTHRSGRKSLVVGTHADSIVDMPLAHGRALLARMLEWAGQPAFTYRHQWQEGDFVIWDNCGLMHRVIPYDARSGRRMHRTTIAGDERVAA